MRISDWSSDVCSSDLSTSAALILHRICDLSPQGHIVMIDPHGEYGAAFQHNGAVYDVNNLALPYWLMNFEEHCEVFVPSERSDERRDGTECVRTWNSRW